MALRLVLYRHIIYPPALWSVRFPIYRTPRGLAPVPILAAVLTPRTIKTRCYSTHPRQLNVLNTHAIGPRSRQGQLPRLHVPNTGCRTIQQHVKGLALVQMWRLTSANECALLGEGIDINAIAAKIVFGAAFVQANADVDYIN